jgi:hypothetical protein
MSVIADAESVMVTFLEENFKAVVDKTIADAVDTKHSMEAIFRIRNMSKKQTKYVSKQQAKHRVDKIGRLADELTTKRSQMTRTRDDAWKVINNPKSTSRDVGRAIKIVIRSANSLIYTANAANTEATK